MRSSRMWGMIFLMIMGVTSTQAESTSDIFKRIRSITTSSWTIEQESLNKLVLTKEQSINYFANSAKEAPFDEPSERYIKHTLQYKMYVKVEDKWDDDEVSYLKIRNASILSEIDKLPQKYNIEHLLMINEYYPTNSKESKLIEEYKSEKEMLVEKLVKLPDFNTTEHSFIISDNLPISYSKVLIDDKAQAEIVELKKNIKNVSTSNYGIDPLLGAKVLCGILECTSNGQAAVDGILIGSEYFKGRDKMELKREIKNWIGKKVELKGNIYLHFASNDQTDNEKDYAKYINEIEYFQLADK